MQPLATLLQEHFTLFIPDFPGHGGRAQPSADWSMDLFARDLLAQVNTAEIASGHFFGYSMGGYVALTLARMAPERVGKVFTLGTKFDWTPETAVREVKMLNPDKMLEKIPHFVGLLKERHAPSDWREVVRRTAGMMEDLGQGAALGEKELGAIAQEVIIARGSEDAMVAEEETNWAAACIPHADGLFLEGQPHPFEKMDPQVVAGSLISFLKNEEN